MLDHIEILSMSEPKSYPRGYTTQPLEPGEIAAVWPMAAPLIEEALKHAEGELTLADILKALMGRYMTLFIATRDGKVELVMVVEIGEFPRYRVARIIAAGGKNTDDAFRTSWHAFENWALHFNCTKIEAWCKPAQWRLWRRRRLFEPVYQVIRRDLKGRLQ